MEWLAPRIDNPELLELAGLIMRPVLPAAAMAGLRQRLYRPDFGWQALTDFASGQDILPPLIWSMRTKFLLLPAPKSLSPEKRAAFFSNRLEAALAAHLQRRAALQAQLAKAVAALRAAGVTPLLLKGARYLLEDRAAWEAARPMRDIDLLIPEGCGAKAVQALLALGYVADAPSGLRSHHLPELRKAGEGAVIELHTEALAPAGRRVMSTEFVWGQAVAASQALILPAPWQALHAMLHHQACDDGYRLRNIALKPLWEFTCLTHDIDEQGWAGMAAQCAAAGASAMLTDWVLQANSIYGLRIPECLTIPAAARSRHIETMAQARQPQMLRHSRFVLRQMMRGFSKDVMAERYEVPAARVGISLRLRHVLFLLRRYRGQMRQRLLGFGRG